MLVWWAFQNPKQKLMSLDTTLEIEHIYAKKRTETAPLSDPSNIEALGNKAMLEKRVNIRASDYRFSDKKKYYEGFVNDKGIEKVGTDNEELLELARTRKDFTEGDITKRTDEIIDSFVDYLGELDLLK